MFRKTTAIVALTAAAMMLGLNISAVLAENQAGSDGSNLEKLVQQITDTRSNYGENLHQLIDYYKKLGDSQGERLAKQELKEFGKIHKRMYLRGIKAKLVAVNTAAWAESDIVEALVAHRQAYRKSLETLLGVLQGAKDVKRTLLAKRELRDLISVNNYMYLRDADTPGLELRATRAIAEAQTLYTQAMALKKDSKKILVNRYKTQLAMEGFRRLIRKYPSSEKIDDAAFQIGELCRANLKNYQRAIRWYECVLAWDPDTQLQANLRIAQIYDNHLVNRLTALDYYKRALKIEVRDSSEYKRIKRRIRRLSGK